jgi:hypothetical protein
MRGALLSLFVIAIAFYAGTRYNDLATPSTYNTTRLLEIYPRESILLRGEYLCPDGCDRGFLTDGKQKLFITQNKLGVSTLNNSLPERFVDSSYFCEFQYDTLIAFGITPSGIVVIKTTHRNKIGRSQCEFSTFEFDAIVFEDGRIRYV